MGFFTAFDIENEKSLGGNYGLADAALALEFVHQNAENLGADAGKIIIRKGVLDNLKVMKSEYFYGYPYASGESAGGGMTMALLLHKESSDRIQGAFVQSGATLFNFLSTDKAQ